MNNTRYFPHDYHARHDPKISAMIKEWKAEGYGLFWCLVEKLYEENTHKFEKFPKLYEGLGNELSVEPEKIKKFVNALINDYRLLRENSASIWSDSVLKRINIIKDKHAAKVKAGQKGGLASGKSRNKGKKGEAK